MLFFILTTQKVRITT